MAIAKTEDGQPRNKEKDNRVNELKTEMMTRGQRKIVLKVYICKICGHEWAPRKETKPKNCPSCRSIRWEKGK